MRGFTLIELLVAIVVAAILATVAVPSFQGLLARNRLAIEYNAVLSGLHFARSEAIKRRDAVTATIRQADGSWQLVVTDATTAPLMSRAGVGDEVAVPSGAVTFNGLGRRESCSGWTHCLISITSEAESSTLGIGMTGRIVK